MVRPMQMTVLGLGNMGSALAARLLDGGHDVVVWNRTASRADALVARGARAAADIAEAAATADAVMISVRDDDAATEVVGALSAAGVSVPVVNCTTSAPPRTSAMADLVPTFVAAPILGAPQAVANGTATYVVAGPPAQLAALEPVWPCLTNRVLNCGADPARASTVKLMSNHLLLSGLVALSEAVVVGQAAGLEDDMVRDVLGSHPMVPTGLLNRLDDLIDGDHTRGWFDTTLGAKDLALFVDLAAAHGVDPVLAELARDRYLAAADSGLSSLDAAAVVELLRRT